MPTYASVSPQPPGAPNPAAPCLSSETICIGAGETATFFEEERQEKARANAKAERERQIQKLRAEQARNREVNQKRMDDEAARRFAEEEVRREAREAERKRLRERAAEAQAAEERGDKFGKWPRWTQGK